MAEKKFAPDFELRCDKPLATEALKLQARLMRAAGGFAEKLPGIIGAVKAGATEEARVKANGEALGAISDVFGRLTPDEYASLVSDIVGLAQIKRPSGYDRLDLDGDMSDRLGMIIPVCAWVLKEVLGDFFSAALANGARAAKVGA